MKLLPLEFTHRTYLLNKSALILDGDGNESLAGLTCIESSVYLEMFDKATKGILPDCMGRLGLFLSMHDRHTAALPDSLWLTNAVFGLSQQQADGVNGTTTTAWWQ